MKIDICSDLHADAWLRGNKKEYVPWEYLKNNESKVLVVAGDTSNKPSTTLSIMEQASRLYDWVIFTDGNHEHYDSHISVLEQQRSFELTAPHLGYNIRYLGGDSFKINDVLFVGACGWYDWNCYVDRGISRDEAHLSWMMMSNDSRYVTIGSIPDPTFDYTKQTTIEWIANRHKNKIKSIVDEANSNDLIRTVVVVTHTSPSAELMDWRPNEPSWNRLTPSYVNTSMSEVFEQPNKISTWVYGHTHDPGIVKLPGYDINFANNARGYPGELHDFKLLQVEV